MKIVIISATEDEIAPCRSISDCIFIVSGLGATNAAIATMRAIEQHKPDIIIQAGIAGAIDRRLQLSQVVCVLTDYQADLGAMRQNRFEPFMQIKYFGKCIEGFRMVSARSVNTACGTQISLDEYAQIESMEGAAFFAAASQYENLNYIQIRAISNYIDTPRAQWCVSEAIEALTEAIKLTINSYRMKCAEEENQ